MNNGKKNIVQLLSLPKIVPTIPIKVQIITILA